MSTHIVDRSIASATPADRRRPARVALAFLDATWIWAWLAWMNELARAPFVPLATLLVVYWFAGWAARRIGRTRAPDAAARLLMATAFSVALLTIVWWTRAAPTAVWSLDWVVQYGRDLTGIGGTRSGAFPLVLGVAVATALAARASAIPMTPSAARRAVLRALVALVLLAVLVRLIGGTLRFEIVLPAAALCALLVLSGARRARSGTGLSMRLLPRVGVVHAVFGIGAALVLGTLGATIISLERADTLARTLAPVELVQMVLSTFVLVFAWLTYGILYVVFGAISLMLGDTPFEVEGELRGPEGLQGSLVEPGPPLDLPPWVLPVLQVLVAVLVLGLITLVVSRLFLRPEREIKEMLGGRPDSVFTRDRLLRDAIGAMGALRERARELLQPAFGGSPMRRMYAKVVEAGAQAGQARRPSATPREHTSVLDSLVPSMHDRIERVTRAYEAARYSNLAPYPKGELDSLRDDTAQVVAAIRAESDRRAKEEQARWDSAVEDAESEQTPESFGHAPARSDGSDEPSE